MAAAFKTPSSGATTALLALWGNRVSGFLEIGEDARVVGVAATEVGACD